MMTERDLRRLIGCDALLIKKLTAVLAVMDADHHPMMVTDGARTVSQQRALFAQGRTAPGRIVTWVDGIEQKSRHQSGSAADCCFLVEGKPSWDEHLPWELYGEAAENEGLIWGGRWAAPKTDRPHVELPGAV